MRLAAALAVLCPLTGTVASAGVPVTIAPAESVIRITPSYRGELVAVQGSAPEDCAVVVRLTSPGETRTCTRKGKVGPFWLSVDRIRFDDVPRMYKVKASGTLDDIVDADEQVRYELGARGLKAAIMGAGGPERDLYVDELILIQRRDRLYDFEDGAVERRGATFRTSFFWPPDGPPGRYRLEAFAVRAGRVVGSAEAEVDVRSVGVEAWVRGLAGRHGILYGLLSVGLAIATGLAASVVFSMPSRRRSPPASSR
jgi:uncharacterized protein (TIGR02186 family)